MDEDIAIINSNTRNQRIKDFFTKKKKLLISLLILGSIDKEGKVILVHPSQQSDNGLPIA